MNAMLSFRCLKSPLQRPTSLSHRSRPGARKNRSCLLVLAADSFYAVAVGRNPGIYETWGECKDQTDRYSGAVFKKFPTLEAAQDFMYQNGAGILKNQQGNLVKKKIQRKQAPRQQENRGGKLNSAQRGNRSSDQGDYHREYNSVQWSKSMDSRSLAKVPRLDLVSKEDPDDEDDDDDVLLMDPEADDSLDNVPPQEVQKKNSQNDEPFHMLDDVAVFFDGVVQRKNSQSGIGAVIKLGWSGKIIAQSCKFFDEELSVYEASLRAALMGLDLARQINAVNVNLAGDSKFVIGALNGQKRIQKENLLKLFEEIQEKMEDYNVKQIKLLSASENEAAEVFAKQALTLKQDSSELFLDDAQKQYNENEQIQNLDKQQQNKNVEIHEEVLLWQQQQQQQRQQYQPQQQQVKQQNIAQPPKTKTAKDIEWLEAQMPFLHQLQNLQKVNRNQSPVIIQYDGACQPNPGRGGCGAVILDSTGKTQLMHGFWYIGNHETCNTAEYKGIILGLLMAKAIGAHNIRLQGDSELTVNQINRNYQVTKSHLKELLRHIRALLEVHFQNFDEKEHIIHISRYKNQVADELSKDALYNQKTGFEVKLMVPEKMIEDFLY
eukprot:TRINITY_DN1767_c0_g2_i3.p1 TRINITY_DN1767_c0_g2~~TRINITY_DN1767_c0_g2_i3.p1  ORF type:complete len:634 (-),score=76.73 TRINITY_DN1767_c0_g2_i3:50-1864(-)